MTQNNPARSAIGYVLLTRGPRHISKPLLERPGAATQVRGIGSYAQRKAIQIISVQAEYLRNADSPNDFVELFNILGDLKGRDAASILVIADVRRLLKRLPASQMVGMLKRLDPYFAMIHDAQIGGPLSEVSEDFWHPLINELAWERKYSTAVRTARRSPARSNPFQMIPAQVASQIRRAEKADTAAARIGELRDRLASQNPGERLTFAAIARESNDEGLRTTRNSLWSSKSVARALERLNGRRMRLKRPGPRPPSP